MSRRRRRERYDKYGIYEIPDYTHKKKKRKKKKKYVTLKGVMRLLGIFCFSFILIYAVSYSVKYSMKVNALELYNEQDYQGALDLLEEALKPRLPLLETFDNDIRFYLADCYVNDGDYGNACMEYELIKLWSKNGNEEADEYEEIVYGLILYTWKDYRQALPILLKAYDEGYSDLVLYLGSCYGQTGDLENMQIYYNVFLQNHEMNSFMYSQYAALSLSGGDMEHALEYIEKGKALEDQSNIKEILYDEIVYYEKLNDYNTAFEKAKVFVEQYPSDTDGKNEYDILYTRQTIDDK